MEPKKKRALIALIVFFIILVIIYYFYNPLKNEFISILNDNMVNKPFVKKLHYEFKVDTLPFLNSGNCISNATVANTTEKLVIPDISTGISCLGFLVGILNPHTNKDFTLDSLAIFTKYDGPGSNLHRIEIVYKKNNNFDIGSSIISKYNGDRLSMDAKNEILYKGINLHFNIRRLIIICDNYFKRDLILYFNYIHQSQFKSVRFKDIIDNIIVVDFF